MRALAGLRVLLGAVMIVTAIHYFMPLLIPLPAPAWDDPKAARLMDTFDRSGLLAVAKFIHLVAGALLVIRRAVPFALAALMPVNLCGLFIALFLEADVLIAALAILTVALNALLMFAYLPSYQGVLTGPALADGEAPEPGRYFESLFANPFTGAASGRFLAGAAVLAAAIAFYAFVVPYANGTTGLVTLAIPTVILAAGFARALIRRG